MIFESSQDLSWPLSQILTESGLSLGKTKWIITFRYTANTVD